VNRRNASSVIAKNVAESYNLYAAPVAAIANNFRCSTDGTDSYTSVQYTVATFLNRTKVYIRVKAIISFVSS
jgi:hypothetical protein